MGLKDRISSLRARSALVDQGVRAFERYRRLDIEYAALKVVGRGVFLSVILILLFLLVFDRATDLIEIGRAHV